MSAALYIVIVAMLFQQAMSYMAAQVLPNVAPQVGASLLLDPELVLYHTTLFYAISGIFQASVGGLIIRWGAIRASQISLLGLGLGLALSMVGTLWSFALAAILMGAANSFSTPASSHLLARQSPPKYAPLIFSIKQTGVPVGGQFAVLAAWLLVADSQPDSWTRAFLATSAICFVLMVVIHPMRKQFDADRNPGYPVRFSDAVRNIGMTAKDPNLRALAFAMFTFVGLQGLFNSIFATFAQTTLGYDKDTALEVLLAVNVIAALARIGWGWIGSSLLPARGVLAALAFVMAAATVAIGLAEGWPFWMLAVAALAFGASALSWHGLLLSEVARLAAPGQVGPVTGGVLFFGALGMLSYPLAAKILRNFGVPYETIFLIAALPALLIGIRFLWPVRQLTPQPAPPVATAPPAPPPPPPSWATPRAAEPQRAPVRPARRYRWPDLVEMPPLWGQARFRPVDAVHCPNLQAALRAARRRR